ncbi:MAG TPA: tripartite tricarboxylate transporter substrate binding protein [Alphaproteobacteria bacterium]|nr:tripartite tricarboxylate transporter substrate binding protein [Alphaproteobacteria bacterium]
MALSPSVRAIAAFCAVSALALPLRVQAQAYPEKPIHLIVGFQPGGVTDIAARVVGQKLSEAWKQQVVIENRTGAAGMVAVEVVSHAAPDGYTLLVTSTDFLTINPSAYAKLPYDPDKGFTTVASLTNTPVVFVTGMGTGINNLKDLIAAAKAKPGTVAFASPGPATTNHLTGELFADVIGTKVVHVPYRGGVPAAQAVVANEVQFGVIAISSAQPFVQGGTMKILGVASPERVSLAPQWPTIAEGGVTGFDAGLRVGMWGPAGLAKPVVDKLQGEIATALKEKSLLEKFAVLGAEPAAMSVADFTAQIKREAERYAKVVKQEGIRIE